MDDLHTTLDHYLPAIRIHRVNACPVRKSVARGRNPPAQKKIPFGTGQESRRGPHAADRFRPPAVAKFKPKSPRSRCLWFSQAGCGALVYCWPYQAESAAFTKLFQNFGRFVRSFVGVTPRRWRPPESSRSGGAAPAAFLNGVTTGQPVAIRSPLGGLHSQKVINPRTTTASARPFPYGRTCEDGMCRRAVETERTSLGHWGLAAQGRFIFLQVPRSQ